MNNFINFLQEYKSLIVSFATFILTLILIFIKRRPKTLDDFVSSLDEVLVTVPSIINSVECPGNGLAKKKEVLSISIHLLQKKLGRDISKSELDYAYRKIDSSIELILSTPQKKGVEVC